MSLWVKKGTSSVSVQQNRLNVLIGLRVVVGTDNESLAVGQINPSPPQTTDVR